MTVPEDFYGGEPDTKLRRVRTLPVSKVPLKRRTWLWEQRVPLGEVTIFAGHAGIGKSQAAVWLAAALSRGQLPGELHHTPTPSLYLGTEDSWSYTLAPRFVAAGADLDLVHRLYVERIDGSETVVQLAVDLDQLREEISYSGAKLVILDALLSTMGSSDLGQQGVVRSYLEPLARTAQDMNVAVVGVAHFRKAGGAEPLHMISGSAEFGQVVRSAVGFARDNDADDDSCVMSLIKTNITPQGLPSLRYKITPAVVDTPDGPTDVGRFVVIGETDRSVRDLIDQHTSPDDRTERDEAAEWLLGFLADRGGSAQAAEVFQAAKADHIAEATLKRARKRAGVRSVRRGFGKGSEWSIDEPFGSHTAQWDQGVGADPNAPNGDPDGDNVLHLGRRESWDTDLGGSA